MASVCFAEIPPELQDKICKPDTLPDAKIKAIDTCFVGFKVDPSSIESCNEKKYGKISLNEKRKKVCGMNPNDRRRSAENVSTNRIDLSLDFDLYLLFVFR